jgi:hypothetical protein|tara:strand:- start:8 stop:205 length:198 start_codon:yes stop_codon:yes gene_type:complete
LIEKQKVIINVLKASVKLVKAIKKYQKDYHIDSRSDEIKFFYDLQHICKLNEKVKNSIEAAKDIR